jgi:hypothetical protein
MPICSAFAICSSSLFSSVLTGDTSESCHTPLNGFFEIVVSASFALPFPLFETCFRIAAVGACPDASACSRILADVSVLASVLMPKLFSWCSFLPIRTGKVDRCCERWTGAASFSSEEISIVSMFFRGNSASSSSSDDSNPPPSLLIYDPPDALYPEPEPPPPPPPPSPSSFMRVAREPDPPPKPEVVR